jgi:predicted negative regulator of RcsB-dependent stress response
MRPSQLLLGEKACNLGLPTEHCTPYMASEATESASFYKLWAWFEANKKQITYGLVAALVLGLIVWYVVWQQGEKEIAADDALSSVYVPQALAGSRTESPENYLKIASTYPKSSAAARAVLFAAGSLFVEGKYADAQAQFERCTREYRDSRFMGEALLGIAACMDAQGKANDALTAYKNLIERHSNENVVPQAKFALARLYEAQGKPDQAFNLFEEIARNDPYGSLGSEAGMRAEELKLKNPKLSPVVPVQLRESEPVKLLKP